MKTIEEVRAYWNARPCNIRHSPKPVGTKDYYDQVEARKYFVEPHIPQFAEFSRWKDKRVLEIGCGIGTDTMNFARAGARVTAVDLTEASLDVARKRAAVYGLEKSITFYQADAEQLERYVPVEHYDLVYSFGVIHHTPHPSAVIRQVRQYMGPDSTFKIMVYNRYSWKVLWILLSYGKGAFWKLDELIARYSEAQTGCPVTYSYGKTTLAQLLEEMDITSLSVEHIFPWSIPEYIQYKYKKVWYFRWMPERLFQWLEHRFGWHLCAEAHLKKQQNG